MHRAHYCVRVTITTPEYEVTPERLVELLHDARSKTKEANRRDFESSAELAASQAELADMTHRFKHYSATMEAERAARNPRNTMSYIHEIQGEADIEGKACAEVDRLRVELADAKRLTKAQDDYIAFLYEVEKGRAGMIVSHPHFAYPQSQIDEGIRLRAAIDKAEGRT